MYVQKQKTTRFNSVAHQEINVQIWAQQCYSNLQYMSLLTGSLLDFLKGDMGKMLRLPQLVDMASQVSTNNTSLKSIQYCIWGVFLQCRQSQRFVSISDCFRDGLRGEDELCAQRPQSC